MKLRHSMGIALLAASTMAVTGCFGKKDSATIQLWSSFGAAYTGALDTIVNQVAESTGVKIEHESKGGYPEIRREMISAIAAGDYPNIATGYPDHFVSYLAADVLTPLDDMFSQAEIADFYDEYLEENKFYDNGGANAQQRLYGVPFNKSTELLGYNGVFVDYCATINPALAVLPKTWQEWSVKGLEYETILMDLVNNKRVVYGVQAENGKASGFSFVAEAGKKELLNFSNADPNQTLLMAWDSPENAFITLIKQWGARYTELPTDQAMKPANRRQGKVWFTSSEDKPKVVELLKFLRGLHKNKIFGVPGHLGGSYASSAFEQCRVMFMVCSSGGLSYNTTNWAHRFSVAPIPYFDDGVGTVRKYVISQGANLCLTNKDGKEDAFKVLKALSSGEFQTKWCLETGYFPSSKSAAGSAEYQAFLNGTSYESATAVAYREGSKINSDYYINASQGWNKFVDPAFVGSAILREKLTGIIKAACDLTDEQATDAKFGSLVDELKSVADLQTPTVAFQ